MDRIQYMAIRGERDFLYRYFIGCGGDKIGEQQFNQLLPAWLMQMGVHPNVGVQQIVNYLDNKFA